MSYDGAKKNREVGKGAKRDNEMKEGGAFIGQLLGTLDLAIEPSQLHSQWTEEQKGEQAWERKDGRQATAVRHLVPARCFRICPFLFIVSWMKKLRLVRLSCPRSDDSGDVAEA